VIRFTCDRMGKNPSKPLCNQGNLPETILATRNGDYQGPDSNIGIQSAPFAG
jgi:hypothetical protein